MKSLLAIRTSGSWLWLSAAHLWRNNVQKIFCLSALSLLTLFATYAQNITPPTDFRNWEWETAPYSSANTYSDAYIRTWRANIQSGSGVFTADMRAPWNNANSAALDLIATNLDYQKAKGWQLVRFDFGGLTAVTVPYFMLYHRPTGVLRIYAYIADNTGSYTGSVITLSHSANDGIYSGHSAATMSAASVTTSSTGLLQAPDKYRTNSASTYGQEQMTYVSFLNSKQGWTMAQFTLGFDPSINDAAAYQMNKYQIQIFGLVSSAVDLKGAFEFETTKKDYAYGGPAITPKPNSTVTDGQDFVVGTQKYLGGLATTADQIKNIATKADGFAKLADQSKLTKEIKESAQQAKKVSTLANIAATAGKIGELAGTFGSVFSLAGTIIGFFTDDANSSSTSFVPTTSKGTITLSGTITTKKALHTFMLLTPGTQHYLSNSGSTQTPDDSRSQLPFNDCPTGIFNIQNTPVLQYASYDQWTTEKVFNDNYAPGSGEMRRLTNITSYKLLNELKPTVNVSSGLEIQSVQYALALQLPLVEFRDAYRNYEPNRGYQVGYNYDGWRDKTWNFLYGRVISGEAILLPYDSGTASDQSDAKVIYQTPFAACTAGLYPLTAPTSSGIPYLRVMATLHVRGTPANSAPVYYVQDYAVDLQQANPGPPSGTAALNARPFFQVEYQPQYPIPATVYSPDVIKTGSLTYNIDYFDPVYSGEVAYGTLLFATNSSVTIQGQYSSSVPVAFQASRSVGIAGELAVPIGRDVSITTDAKPIRNLQYACTAPAPQYYEVNIPCTQNDRALRPSAPLATTTNQSAELATLTLAPNPASGSTSVHLSVTGTESIQQVEVLNVEGQVLWTKAYSNLRELKETLSLGAFRSGVYIVRATTSNRVYTSKLSVQ